MVEIKKLSAQDYEEFKDMFITYFTNELGVKYDLNKLREGLLDKHIIKQFEGELIYIDIIKEDVKNFYLKNGFVTNHIKAENGLEYFEKGL